MKSHKQLSLIKQTQRKDHGGSLALHKRRTRRALSTKHSLHITLKSDIAIGGRCLLKHKKLILRVMKKASYLFRVRVYHHAICGNHLHLLVKGSAPEDLQNFFRVFAGHTAQGILKECPLTPREVQNRGGAPHNRRKNTRPLCKKNQRKFWIYLIYSRVITWGREFKTVSNYILKNTLEALHLIAYTRRKRKTTAFPLPTGQKQRQI